MISRKHRCIFVHIPKTGGTSIEAVIWPGTRTCDDLYMGVVNGYNKYQTGGLQHLLAHQIRTEVGSDVYNNFFKFSIVRNPWDRTVSQYTYMKLRPDLRRFIGMNQDDTFDTYLKLIQQKRHIQWEPQISFLKGKNNDIIVDHIGRFENFTNDVAEIFSILKIKSPIPYENKSIRADYRIYYTNDSKEVISNMYADDIKEFNYSF